MMSRKSLKKVWNLVSHHAWRTKTQERAAQLQHIWAPKSPQTLPCSIQTLQTYNSSPISSSQPRLWWWRWWGIATKSSCPNWQNMRSWWQSTLMKPLEISLKPCLSWRRVSCALLLNFMRRAVFMQMMKLKICGYKPDSNLFTRRAEDDWSMSLTLWMRRMADFSFWMKMARLFVMHTRSTIWAHMAICGGKMIS